MAASPPAASDSAPVPAPAPVPALPAAAFTLPERVCRGLGPRLLLQCLHVRVFSVCMCVQAHQRRVCVRARGCHPASSTPCCSIACPASPHSRLPRALCSGRCSGSHRGGRRHRGHDVGHAPCGHRQCNCSSSILRVLHAAVRQDSIQRQAPCCRRGSSGAPPLYAYRPSDSSMRCIRGTEPAFRPEPGDRGDRTIPVCQGVVAEKLGLRREQQL